MKKEKFWIVIDAEDSFIVSDRCNTFEEARDIAEEMSYKEMKEFYIMCSVAHTTVTLVTSVEL